MAPLVLRGPAVASSMRRPNPRRDNCDALPPTAQPRRPLLRSGTRCVSRFRVPVCSFCAAADLGNAIVDRSDFDIASDSQLLICSSQYLGGWRKWSIIAIAARVNSEPFFITLKDPTYLRLSIRQTRRRIQLLRRPAVQHWQAGTAITFELVVKTTGQTQRQPYRRTNGSSGQYHLVTSNRFPVHSQLVNRPPVPPNDK